MPRWDKQVDEQIETNLKRYQDKPWFKEAMQALKDGDNAASEAEATRLLALEAPFYVYDYQISKAETDRRGAGVRANAATMHGAPEPFDVRQALRAVKVPTLVVSAEADFVCDPRFGRELHEAIAGSRFVLIEKAGHLAHWDQPAAVTAAIAAFVEELERRR